MEVVKYATRKGQRHTIERLKTEEGLLTDQKGIAEELSRYFSSLAGTIDGNVDDVGSRLPVSEYEFKFKRVATLQIHVEAQGKHMGTPVRCTMSQDIV